MPQGARPRLRPLLTLSVLDDEEAGLDLEAGLRCPQTPSGQAKGRRGREGRLRSAMQATLLVLVLFSAFTLLMPRRSVLHGAYTGTLSDNAPRSEADAALRDATRDGQLGAEPGGASADALTGSGGDEHVADGGSGGAAPSGAAAGGAPVPHMVSEAALAAGLDEGAISDSEFGIIFSDDDDQAAVDVDARLAQAMAGLSPVKVVKPSGAAAVATVIAVPLREAPPESDADNSEIDEHPHLLGELDEQLQLLAEHEMRYGLEGADISDPRSDRAAYEQSVELFRPVGGEHFGAAQQLGEAALEEGDAAVDPAAVWSAGGARGLQQSSERHSAAAAHIHRAAHIL